jgi:uncharacterized protein (DUF2141 family)
MLRIERVLGGAAGVALGFLVSAGAPAMAEETTPTATGVVRAPIDHVSCTGAANEVRVTVSDVRESIGLMVADLYRNDADGFLKTEGRVQQVRFAAKAPETQFCFHAPSPGLYAIALYHDENANKTLDKKLFGLPAEPFGISNDPRLVMAPPKIEDTLFEVAEDGTFVDIRLRQ